MMNSYPVFSTLLSPEVLAAASVTRIAFLDDSPLTRKPIVSSIVDISARARSLVTSDVTKAAAAPVATDSTTTPTTTPATPPVQAVTPDSTTQQTAASTATTPAVTHVNPPPTVVDPFTDSASFAKTQANSFATAQAVAAYYLMSGFGKDASSADKGVAYLPPSDLVSPVNPVARIAALQLELHP